MTAQSAPRTAVGSSLKVRFQVFSGQNSTVSVTDGNHRFWPIVSDQGFLSICGRS